MFPQRNEAEDLCVCWPPLVTERRWLRFGGRRRELFLRLRRVRMVSVTIPCFIFRRLRKRSRNYLPKKSLTTAIGAGHFGSFYVGVTRTRTSTVGRQPRRSKAPGGMQGRRVSG